MLLSARPAAAQGELGRTRVIGDLASTIERAAPSTVFLLAIDEDGLVLQGSGVVVGADGWLVTSYELVAWTEVIEAQVEGEHGVEAQRALLVRTFPSLNLALLWVPTRHLVPLPAAGEDWRAPGCELIALGYPSYTQHQRALRLSRGTFNWPAFFTGPGETVIYSTSVPYLEGMAGAAVVNPAGELVGVAVGPGPWTSSGDGWGTYVVPWSAVEARLSAVAEGFIEPPAAGFRWLSGGP